MSIWSTFAIEELLTAGKTVFGEARGLDDEGRRAVAHVILNRWKARKAHFGFGLGGVCLRHHQFSCWNEFDPNLEAIEHAKLYESRVLRECINAFLRAMDEDDFTFGSTHYHTDAVAPKWAQGHGAVGKWGPHLFYNTVK